MAKLLLVEDDNNLREIYEARLMAEGYQIVTAEDGEQALVVAKAERPDLIISDVMMPKISGFEMLDILRNTEGLRDVKVVMLTALGQAEDKTRADSLGADKYLVKSQVTLEDIVKVAHELLGEAEEPEATSPAAETTAAPEPASVGPPAAPAPVIPVTEPPAEPTVSTAAAPPVPAIPVVPPATNASAAVPSLTSTTPLDAPNIGGVPSASPAEPAAEAAPSSTPSLTIPAPEQAPAAVPTVSAPSVPMPTAAMADAAEPVAVSTPEPASPAPTEPAPTPPTTAATTADVPNPVAVTDITTPVTMTSPQTAAEEEASVQSQIDNFVEHVDTEPAAVTPETTPAAPETPAATDDKLMDTAVDALVANTTPETSGDVAAVEVPSDAPKITPLTAAAPLPEEEEATDQQAPTNDAVTIANKKIIRPIEGEKRTDLAALVALEEAKEKAAPPQTIVSDTPASADSPAPAALPHQPGTSVSPDGQASPDQADGFDPHSISL